MAKGASTENQLGSLHNKLTQLFTKVLKQYEDNLDKLNNETMQDELLSEVIGDGMPSPAMLSAVAKFLKDNEISLESDAVDELSAMEERLAAKQRNRPNLREVTALPLQNNG